MRRKGFTLVEIMIVVAIIALLAAIAIPNLLRARLSAQEASAASAMKTLCAAQIAYRGSHSNYSTLANLANSVPPYIDQGFLSMPRQGYTYTFNDVTTTGFWVLANSSAAAGSSVNYYIDESGVLCRAPNVAANAPATNYLGNCSQIPVAGEWATPD